jgi:spore coat polysaccharide biosynthesis protein SpsF
MLAQQIRRLRHCGLVDEIVIATTTSSQDQAIVDLARAEGVGWFCGSEQDVLGRIVETARQARADVVVRVTADCPLIDPEITDRVISDLVDHATECDYASNVGLTAPWFDTTTVSATKPLQRSFPRGLDVEAFFWDVLLRIDRLAKTSTAREHVTVLPRSERSDLFLVRTVADDEDNSDLRWTVDTEEDLQTVRTLYDELDLGSHLMPYADMLSYIRAHPHLQRFDHDSETQTG